MSIKISVVNFGAQRKSQTAHYKSFGFPFGDPGGTRTHDPLIKSQLLYQLSYGVSVCSIATAKVLLFSKLPTILAIFLKKSAFSHFAEFGEIIHLADFQLLRVLLKNSLFFG